MDIGLKIPSTYTLEIREKLLVVMVYLYIGTILATILPITQVKMVYCSVYQNLKEEIVRVMMKDVEVGLNRSSTLPFTMLYKVLMVGIRAGLRHIYTSPITINTL